MSGVQMPVLNLYLIRHGQTAWSLSGQHTGRTDIPLTAFGEDEVRDLVPWLGRIRFSRVLTSPRQRAKRTCELAGLGQRAETEPDLAEWDYGDYEGKLSADIRMGRPDWNVFRDGCPNGEMPAQVSARADRLIAHLRTMDGNVALFSHGEFGLVLVARWIGLPVIEGQHFLLETASLSILGYNPAHPEVRVIALWDATPALLLPGDGMTGCHSQVQDGRQSLSD
jgi:probable phosphoglycerate mutase